MLYTKFEALGLVVSEKKIFENCKVFLKFGQNPMSGFRGEDV